MTRDELIDVLLEHKDKPVYYRMGPVYYPITRATREVIGHTTPLEIVVLSSQGEKKLDMSEI